MNTEIFQANSMLDVLLKLICGPLATLALAWIAGQRISARWGLWQKRRELAHSAANEFYRLYGEFFSIWKLWNYAVGDNGDASSSDRRWELLNRAARTEAGFEALLVKMTAERQLSTDDIQVLGSFRQGCQQLRKRMKEGAKLDWRSSQDHQYLAFKRLSARVAAMIATADLSRVPSPGEAASALEEITSNGWEVWWDTEPSKRPDRQMQSRRRPTNSVIESARGSAIGGPQSEVRHGARKP